MLNVDFFEEQDYLDDRHLSSITSYDDMITANTLMTTHASINEEGEQKGSHFTFREIEVSPATVPNALEIR